MIVSMIVSKNLRDKLKVLQFFIWQHNF